MSEETIVVKTETETATTQQTVTPTGTEGEAEARILQLEAEKNKAIEEAANYKLAFLKAKNKNKEDLDEESEEDRISRIVSEKLTATKIAQIDVEKEELLKKLAKENKELKLAQLNKTNTPAAAIGAHSETTVVTDTLVTPEQITALKARGWTDKDIERYKKNFLKNSGR